MERLGPESDVDYVATRFVPTGGESRTLGVLHGWGFSWTYGYADRCDVWKSVEYREVFYETALSHNPHNPPDPRQSKQLRDARGTTVDGKKWRYLGRFTESARYSDAIPAEAQAFDQLLDSFCWKTR